MYLYVKEIPPKITFLEQIIIWYYAYMQKEKKKNILFLLVLFKRHC